MKVVWGHNEMMLNWTRAEICFVPKEENSLDFTQF